jgi:hypothetical protein
MLFEVIQEKGENLKVFGYFYACLTAIFNTFLP